MSFVDVLLAVHPAESEIRIAEEEFLTARYVARPRRFTLPELEALHEQLEVLVAAESKR